MTRTSILILFLLVLSQSCYYYSSGVHEVEVEQVTPGTVTINSNLDSIDSIVVADSLFFQFEVVSDSIEVYFSQLFVDNLYVTTFEETFDSIYLYPYNIYSYKFDGIILTLVTYYKTYSNSLADIYDAEYATESSSWVFYLYPREE